MKSLRVRHFLFGLLIVPFAASTAAAARNAFAAIAASDYDAVKGEIKASGTAVGGFDGKDAIFFSQVDFGGGAQSIQANVAVPALHSNQILEIHIGTPEGSPVAILPIKSTGSWNTFESQSANLNKVVTGLQDVYLVGRGGSGIANIQSFQFSNQPAAGLKKITPSSQSPVIGGGIPRPGAFTTLKDSGPITLVSNQTYSGLRITNPNGRCFTGTGVTNVRITNSEIGPCGDGTDSEQLGIGVYDSSNITVDHNIIHDVATGLDAVRSRGVIFANNYVYRLRGPMPSGQLTQFENVSGPGNKVLCNIGQNTEGDTTEDSINLWMSRGTPESFIEVAYNRISGGHSKTGSGIILGDGNGAAYIDVHDNTIVNANNVGIGIAGGDFMKVRNNRIYNNASFTSIGLTIRNFYASCTNIEVTNNRVWGFDRIWWGGGPREWHTMNTGECSNVNDTGNVYGDTSLSAAMLAEDYPQCQ